MILDEIDEPAEIGRLARKSWVSLGIIDLPKPQDASKEPTGQAESLVRWRGINGEVNVTLLKCRKGLRAATECDVGVRAHRKNPRGRDIDVHVRGEHDDVGHLQPLRKRPLRHIAL